MSEQIRVLHVLSGDLWAGAEVQAYTLLGQLHCFPKLDVGAVIMNNGVLADKLRGRGIRVEIADESRLNSFRIERKLRRFIQHWRPDVVHMHRDKDNVLGLLANRMADNVPTVRTVHGSEEHSDRSRWRAIRRSVVRRLDRWATVISGQTIIAVSQALGEQLRRIYPAERIVVIENGVDVGAIRAQIAPVEFRMCEPEATHVGIVGRMVPVKRMDLFLQAAALLREQDRERRWRFHLFGDGPLRGSLEVDAEVLQISPVVTFHGQRGDIARCLAGLDALVICSDHEGMPMTALEAAAVGVPTVAHAVGGLTEVIPREFWVTQHDALGYRDAVSRALREDARFIAKSMARKTCVRFSATRNATLTHALYERLLGRRGTN